MSGVQPELRIELIQAGEWLAGSESWPSLPYASELWSYLVDAQDTQGALLPMSPCLERIDSTAKVASRALYQTQCGSFAASYAGSLHEFADIAENRNYARAEVLHSIADQIDTFDEQNKLTTDTRLTLSEWWQSLPRPAQLATTLLTGYLALDVWSKIK